GAPSVIARQRVRGDRRSVWPSFETRRCATLLRMRIECVAREASRKRRPHPEPKAECVAREASRKRRPHPEELGRRPSVSKDGRNVETPWARARAAAAHQHMKNLHG